MSGLRYLGLVHRDPVNLTSPLVIFNLYKGETIFQSNLRTVSFLGQTEQIKYFNTSTFPAIPDLT